jgi:hypothetical protein
VFQERHFRDNELHGIERVWNWRGRLQRGYPRYWVRNRRVTKNRYMRLCLMDTALPRFRVADNSPERVFPPEMNRALRIHRGRSA